ncbi:MAG: hypothetical protein JSS61_05455 [Verrucomicrobia bacterium]|nr:hypothetical protein [Verrucomicrobiota bacterium]
MRTLLVLLLLSISPLALEALTLKQKVENCQGGDYILTAQESNYSLLIVRSRSEHTLVLEEIAIPKAQVDLKKMDWQGWLTKFAPGHTSWTAYEIDLDSGKLIECYSYSKQGWLALDSSEQFLARLFSLPLRPVQDKERKRIGRAPSGDADHRPLWNPPLVEGGKKALNPSFEVWKTRWPDDGSLLALCQIELYFSKGGFPLPYWIEVQSPHYAFKMRTVDSGHKMTSPRPLSIPKRPQL